MGEIVSISDFSSLNFRTDWKLDFQKNECYEQKFLPSDTVRVQYICMTGDVYSPYLKNCSTGEIVSIPFEKLLEDADYTIAEFTIIPGNITEETLFYLYLAKAENEEPVLATYFRVCLEIPNSILLKYTHRRDDFGTIFSESRLFCFRVEGNFLPQEISFENESEDFRDQRFVAKMLSDFTYEKKTLTIGGGFGVPNWVARKINLIFSLSAVYVDEQPMVRSEGSSVKINLLHNDYPLYVYKIELENSDDSLTINDPSAIEFSRVTDEKKKLIRRCSENEVRVYNEIGVAFNPETAKMIHELDTILEISENYLIEVDDNKSENTYKTPLNSVILLFAKEFLSKKHEDSADAVITFLKGLKVGNYIPGLTGSGARIDERGYAEMTGLTLREFLEVPEYRFNRVDVVNGELWNAPGFGLIESVDIENSIVTLKLEDKELSGIKTNDLCRGLFHNLTDNADGVVTDGCGFLTLAGFSTSYFTPVELLEDGRSFRYELKPGTTVHPSPAMKFAVYGNFTDKSRQSSAYSTRTYKRYLKDVNTWEIDVQRNIAMQFGDLSDLIINGVSMSGYSAYLNNIYFTGYMEWTPEQLEEMRGKDGYSVALTSYDAVVAVDSQGRIDSSLYDIINIVNGEELIQSAGTQVVTSRYQMQTEIQALQGNSRLEYHTTPGSGQYSALFTAKGCEYSFASGVLTITKITEDKANVEIEVNCEGFAVFRMTYTLTRVYGGVNPDWTGYVFKRSETNPGRPVGVSEIPEGWSDSPDSIGIWWMSKATFSGITGEAGEWSDPVRVTAEDGADGINGGYTDFKYCKNNSSTIAPDLDNQVRHPEGWSDVPSSLSAGEYLWMIQAEIGAGGNLSGSWSTPVRISGENGRSGDWTSYVFRESVTQPAIPAGTDPLPDGWKDGPSGSGVWWMSKAVVSGITGQTGAWSIPVRVTGTDGTPGEDGSYACYEYAVCASMTISPSSGWSATVPDVPSGSYLWMKWGIVVPPATYPASWDGIARITGEKGSSGDWTSYVFKESDVQPAMPAGPGVVPEGWQDGPGGTGKWWMSRAVISGITGEAGEWSAPVQVTAEDGTDGGYTDFKYCKNNSETIAPELNAGVRHPDGWSDTPSQLLSGEYLWMTQAKIEADDSLSGSWSTPVRISGEKGTPGEHSVVVYKSSATQPDSPVGVSVPPSGWSLTPPVREEGMFIWISSPLYDSEKNITGWSIPVKFSGDPGSTGLQGMISRVSEWSSGVYYRNDTDTKTDGLRYLDVVVVTNPVTGNFVCYQVKSSHNGIASSESNKPGNTAYWTQMSQLPPLYTPLILAENGVIRFAQSNQLLIQKENGTITAGASGKGDGANGIRFWAGSQEPGQAPWRVDETGKMIAGNADITGKITANGGKIGNFNITKGLEYYSGNAYLTLNESGLSSSILGNHSIKGICGVIDRKETAGIYGSGPKIYDDNGIYTYGYAGIFEGALKFDIPVYNVANIKVMTASGIPFLHGATNISIIFVSFTANSVVRLPRTGCREGQLLTIVNDSTGNYDALIRMDGEETTIINLNSLWKWCDLIFYGNSWRMLRTNI